MDYKEVIVKSFKMIWRHKWLWVFGLFVGGFGGGGGSSNFNAGSWDSFRDTGQNNEWGAFSRDVSMWVNQNLLIVVAFFITIILFAIFLFVLGIIAQGALIGGAELLDKDEEATFSLSLGIGLANFWRILGFYLLLAFIVLTPMLGVVLLVAGAILITDASPVFLILLIPVFLLFLPILLAAGIIGILGPRALVIQKVGVGAALGSAWRLLWGQLGPVLLTWIINVGIAIAFGILFLITLILMLVPSGIGAYLVFMTGFSLVKLSIVVFFGLILLAIFFIIRGAYGAYNSVYWTLAYRRLTEL